jgi:hypothetical protein
MAVDHQGADGVDDPVELSMRCLQPPSAFSNRCLIRDFETIFPA